MHNCELTLNDPAFVASHEVPAKNGCSLISSQEAWTFCRWSLWRNPNLAEKFGLSNWATKSLNSLLGLPSHSNVVYIAKQHRKRTQIVISQYRFHRVKRRNHIQHSEIVLLLSLKWSFPAIELIDENSKSPIISSDIVAYIRKESLHTWDAKMISTFSFDLLRG